MVSNRVFTGVNRLLLRHSSVLRTEVFCCRRKSSSVSPLLVQELTGGIRWLTLNSPATRNSLSLEMLQALHEGLTKDVNDCSLRAIVISAISTGTPSVFSSGHNLKELRMGEDNSLKLQKEIFDTCSKVMLSIKESPVPVICEVNGLAAAAGCQLAASCDIVIASSNSTFSTPGANFGLFCSTPGIAVARSANPKLASMMLITGLPVTAGEALAGGLVSAVVPEHEVRVKTEKILDAIISKSRPVVEQGRRFLQKQVQVSDLTEAYCIGTEEMLDNLRLQDCQEGLNAFAEKRKPSWSHTKEKV